MATTLTASTSPRAGSHGLALRSTRGDDATLEQIVKQLRKLADILKVSTFRKAICGSRVGLIKVSVDSKTRADDADYRYFPRAKIVDVQPKASPSEVTGNESKIEISGPDENFQMLDLTRTGKVALPQTAWSKRSSLRRQRMVLKAAAILFRETIRNLLWQLLTLACPVKKS